MDKVSKYGPDRGLVKPKENKISSVLFDVEESGTNALRVVKFTPKVGTLLTLTDDAGVGQWGSLKLCDLPVGAGKLQAYIDFSLVLPAPFIAAPVVSAGIGTTAAASGIVLATTKQNVSAVKVVAVTGAKTVAETWADVADFSLVGAGLGSLYLNIQVADDVAHATAAGIAVAGVKVKLVLAMFGG